MHLGTFVCEPNVSFSIFLSFCNFTAILVPAHLRQIENVKERKKKQERKQGCCQRRDSTDTLRKEWIIETASKEKTVVLVVELSAYSEVWTWCQATLQAVEGSLFNEMVITSSPKPCSQTQREKDSLEEIVFVPGVLLNYTRLCHHDVPVIKRRATLAHQLLTIPYSWTSWSSWYLFALQYSMCSVLYIHSGVCNNSVVEGE